MYKRDCSVPVLDLENQMANRQRKKCVIDITAPPLKLQKNRPEKPQLTQKSKRVLRALGRLKVEKSLQNHEEKQSLLYESKTTPETFDDVPVSEDENAYIFSIRKCDSSELERQGREKMGKKFIKYEPHPQDKMHQRIQSVEVDFRPMTVEESIGFNQDRYESNRNSKNMSEDPFRKFMPQRKYYRIYPSVFINKDHKRGLFAMQVNRPDSNLNVQNQHRMHDAALNKALEKLSQQDSNDQKNLILVPKPTTKYCFVCRGHFDQYNEHLKTRWHQQNDVNAKIWSSIKEICKKVQGIAVEERIKNLKFSKSEQKLTKKQHKKTLISKNDSSSEKKKIHKSEEKLNINNKEKKNTKEKIKPKEQPELKQSKKDQKNLNTNQKIEDRKPENVMALQTEMQKVQQIISEVKNRIDYKIANIDVKKDKKQHIKQISRQAAILKYGKIKNGPQQKIKNKPAEQQKNLAQTLKSAEIPERDIQVNHKIVKSNTNLAVVPQTQILISILPSEYPKLVPEGHSYRKPSKPACVSMCLTTNNDEKPKKRGPYKKQPKQKTKNVVSKDSSVYIQQKIEDWFKFKKDENQKQFVQQANGKKRQENLGESEKNQKTAQKLQSIVEEKPINSEQTKRQFIGLAKTRSRQKQNMLNPERCQLSPIVTE